MSKQVALAARSRPGLGKGEAKGLRREGRIPAVAYGSGIESTAVSVDARQLFHALHTDAGTNAIIRLELDGDTHLALARQIQRHPVRREVMHVDFVMVDRDVKVTVDVPVHLEGEAPGTDEGGVVDQILFTLSIDVLPLEVPEQLTLDISNLQIGDVKRVADIQLPSGVTCNDDPEAAVVSVNVPQLEVPEEEPTEVSEEEAEVVGAEQETLGEAAAESAESDEE